MRAPASQLAELKGLIEQGRQKELVTFPMGPAFGDDVLPMGPVEAMRCGQAHRVPLIVGTNGEEGRLFTRFLGMLPTNESMFEEFLTDVEPAVHERIISAYPNYPNHRRASSSAATRPSSAAVWQITDASSSPHRPDFRPQLSCRV